MPAPIELSCLEISPAGGLARVAPRPAAQQQASYLDAFDASTIFYDAFRSFDGSSVVLLGPPLANLERVVVPTLMRAAGLGSSSFVSRLRSWSGKKLGSRAELRALDRHAQLWLKTAGGRIDLSDSPFRQRRIAVQPNEHARFAGKNVIVTMSRDNELAWIRDWARFHARAHGCNAVLLYDNGSTRYDVAELGAAIASVAGIDTAVVIHWPYKLGPDGGAHWMWDSDYGQYGMLEHARHRFLPTAAAVLSADIDELVLTRDGASVFGLARKSATGHIRFAGPWIESASAEAPDPAARRHWHYCHIRDGPDALPKWAVVPARCPPRAQWRVHDIIGMAADAAASSVATLRHFKAINTNWKLERFKPEPLDPAHHRLDTDLARWLRVLDEGETNVR
jgi:hypothetical protein